MSKESKENQTVPEKSSDTGFVRVSFRVPLRQDAGCSVTIGQTTYQVSDISELGVCLTAETDTELMVTQTLFDCGLKVDTIHIEGLEADVIHCSPGSGIEWKYGLQWKNPSLEQRQKLSAALIRLKNEFLARQTQSDNGDFEA